MYEINRKHNDLQETIELIDGHPIDDGNSSIVPTAQMVGRLNMKKVNCIYDQLYRFSMVNLGLEEVGDIQYITRYGAYEVIEGVEVRQYIEEFQKLIQSADEKLMKMIHEIVNDIEAAHSVSQNAEYPVIRMFAMLVVYNEQKKS